MQPPEAEEHSTLDKEVKSWIYRYGGESNAEKWLAGKRATDGAQGLWRIHNSLYDLTSFLGKHPGGPFWLEATKETDITEAFESHHISTAAEEILKKFYVKEADIPRSSPYSFEDGGFYSTLKREARQVLETASREPRKIRKFIIDGLMFQSFAFAVLANVFLSYTLGVIAGTLCGFVIILAHSYTHQKDNFRMYYMDLFTVSSRRFRIAHILSHHLFTNAVADIQEYVTEPLHFCFPRKKSWIRKYLSALYVPLLMWIPYLGFATIVRLALTLVRAQYTKSLRVTDILPLVLPLTMYKIGGQSLASTVEMWLIVIASASVTFNLLAFATGHYNSEEFVDRNNSRAKEETDWGIAQLNAVCDRYEMIGNPFIVMFGFGNHALHHLFPTLDSSLLNKLYPVVKKVMRKYNLDVRIIKRTAVFTGYQRRVVRKMRES